MASSPEGGDFGQLIAQMQHLQQSLADAETLASSRSVEGSAGEGAVRVVLSGEFSVDAVSIDPSVVDPTDVPLLEDLVLAAARDGVAKLLEMRRSAMGTAMQSALGDLLGGEGDEALDVEDDDLIDADAEDDLDLADNDDLDVDDDDEDEDDLEDEDQEGEDRPESSDEAGD